MGVRNTNVGTSRFNSQDNQKTTIHELRRVRTGIAELIAIMAGGGGAGDATLVEQQAQTALLTTINTNIADIETLLGGAKSDLHKMQTEANDLVATYTYLDPADPVDRRISTIVYSSAALALSVTDTFLYAGIAGDFYVTSSTLS